MIAVIDYGMGNLRSAQKGLEHAGAHDVRVTDDPACLASADALVLPGVGAFRDAMERLSDSGMVPALRAAVNAGKPLLGICLGMQLLFETSYEFGTWSGLGLIPGTVEQFDAKARDIKVPHIGFNTVTFAAGEALGNVLPPDTQAKPWFYFVHSFHCVPADDADILGTTDYGGRFVSAVRRGSVYGVQFHPEKSSATGLRLLRNFAALAQARGDVPKT
ncbi:MAG: imidazole glycerol phosphate synthase subunit HisH [Actinomycetes bacterium]|jgi:glutamine amidotransferase|nr:imidazole glycerol phosphate synthase subunit HisH [Actinomycetes bacterium]